MPANKVNHCSETEINESQYKGVSINLELTEARIRQNIVQLERDVSRMLQLFIRRMQLTKRKKGALVA